MTRTPQPAHRQTSLPTEVLSTMWFSLHADERFAVRDEDLHYLTSLAVMLDDDLASLLLLRKLKLAERYGSADLPRDVVVLNRTFEYVVDGDDPRPGRVVHSSWEQSPNVIPANSRLGIGLLGLKAGQTILWPDRLDRLRAICVVRVDREAASYLQGDGIS